MKALLACLLLFAQAALAHEVTVAQATQTANVVILRYADGQPLAFEAYELYVPGAETPVQVGHTDGQGRLLFLAEGQTKLRLKAWTADGHGVDREIPAISGTAVVAAPVAPDRWLHLLSGLGIVFGLFGVVQLFARKKTC